MKAGRYKTLAQIFAWPALLGAASLAGLAVALTGDGWRDVFSWLTIGAPVLALGWTWKMRRA